MDPARRQVLEDLKKQLSITRVAEALGLHPEHGKIRCFRPTRHANGDRTPSVSISEEKGLFRCWVCPDVKGDVIDLVKQVNHLSFHEALDWLEFHFPQMRSLIAEFSAYGGKRDSHQEKPLVNKEPSPLTIGHKPQYWREKALLEFLRLLAPVDQPDPSGARLAQQYLVRRKIFKNTWNAMRLRWVHDYAGINEKLKRILAVDLLREIGLINEQGNLRFYKHPLIIPYLDRENRPLHFQARALDRGVEPKELSLKGRIPVPYNVKVLDGSPGWVYLCEGPIDALTLIERHLPAVAVPGVQHMKEEWLDLFCNKRIVICFDNDEAGNAAADKLIRAFGARSIETVRLDVLPQGADINDWFVRDY